MDNFNINKTITVTAVKLQLNTLINTVEVLDKMPNINLDMWNYNTRDKLRSLKSSCEKVAEFCDDIKNDLIRLKKICHEIELDTPNPVKTELKRTYPSLENFLLTCEKEDADDIDENDTVNIDDNDVNDNEYDDDDDDDEYDDDNED